MISEELFERYGRAARIPRLQTTVCGVAAGGESVRIIGTEMPASVGRHLLPVPHRGVDEAPGREADSGSPK
jgi:hypothetical protein